MSPHLKPKGMVTLVNRHSKNIYSGMFPGVISKKYKFEDIAIDLSFLADAAGITFVKAEIIGVDPSKQYLILDNRSSIHFSHLSLDVGSETALNLDQKKLVHKTKGCSIKPFSNSIQWIKEFDSDIQEEIQKPITIIGSGLSAIEIALSLRKRWPKRQLNLQAYEGKIDQSFCKMLISSKINFISTKEKVLGPSLLCTGSKSPLWLKESGFLVNPVGRVFTLKTLQVINFPYIFAVGDCGVVQGFERPPSGVWAVSAAQRLAENLERSLKGLKLLEWEPKSNALQLIGMHSNSKFSLAWAVWGGKVMGPTSWLWKLKNRIDNRFIEKFKFFEGMQSQEEGTNKSCRGCGAKIGANVLSESLESAGLFDLANQPEDAAMICPSSNLDAWVQSVDGFPALVADPWLNARLTTLHACSDIWAVGAKVKSAQAVITLPEVSPNLQKELLRQCLGGIKSALKPQGAYLIGGHTCESRSSLIDPIGLGIQISLTVNGSISDTQKLFNKKGLGPGDQLFLSRPLGSGVIFASRMQGAGDSKYVDHLLSELSKSQHLLLDSNRLNNFTNNHFISACTDITGFGLLGHLWEMLSTSNLKRMSQGKQALQVRLFGKLIPSFQGAKKLLQDGYRSTLSDSNSIMLEHLVAKRPLIDLIFEDPNIDEQELKIIKELVIDPQTCGPLLVACNPKFSNYFSNNNTWTFIGDVREML